MADETEDQKEKKPEVEQPSAQYPVYPVTYIPYQNEINIESELSELGNKIKVTGKTNELPFVELEKHMTDLMACLMTSKEKPNKKEKPASCGYTS